MTSDSFTKNDWNDWPQPGNPPKSILNLPPIFARCQLRYQQGKAPTRKFRVGKWSQLWRGCLNSGFYNQKKVVNSGRKGRSNSKKSHLKEPPQQTKTLKDLGVHKWYSQKESDVQTKISPTTNIFPARWHLLLSLVDGSKSPNHLGWS